MSELIKQETQDLLRREIIRATTDAAMADSVSVNGDALAFVSQPDLMVVNAPITGIERLDFKALLDGDPVLDDTPVMYWYLSGSGFGDEASPIPAGFYTVVAHQKRGAVSLRNATGQTVAEGDLGISIEPPDPSGGTAERPSISGGVDSPTVEIWPPHIHVCGHVTIKDGKITVTISGCLDVGF